MALTASPTVSKSLEGPAVKGEVSNLSSRAVTSLSRSKESAPAVLKVSPVVPDVCRDIKVSFTN